MGREFDYGKYAEWIDPKEVKPYPKNAKLHPPEQVQTIAESIRRFGWQQDTVITADNVLVIGHGRWMAAKLLGCKMPFHRVNKSADDLTDQEIKALRLADNKTAESGFNYDKLREELAEIMKTMDMTGLGFAIVPEEIETEPEYEEPDMDFGDEGFEEYQKPLSREQIQQYSERADELLQKRRVVITYMADQEPEIMHMLHIGGERIRVVYDLSELVQ